MRRRRFPLAPAFGGLLFAAGLVAAVSPEPDPATTRQPDPSPTADWAAPGVTAFVHVAVVPMDSERVLRDQTVVVRGGHIVALGPSARVPVPAGAARVDGRGKYLLPGLADMHAHLRLSQIPLAPRQSDRLLLKEQQLFLWLAQGLTAVRVLTHSTESGDSRNEDILELRSRQAAGALLSPRIVTAGYLKGRLASTSADSVLQQTAVKVSEVAEAVASYRAAGFDVIKVHWAMNSDQGANASGAMAPADSAMFDSLAAAARRVGLPLVGHTIVPLARALQTYQSIEHLSGYIGKAGFQPVLTDSLLEHLPPDSLAARIRELAAATQRAGVWNCPTLYVWNHHAAVRAVSPRELAAARQLVKALQDAGVQLLAGSDGMYVLRPEFEKLIEIADLERKVAQLQAAGITTYGRALLEFVHGNIGATHQEFRTLVEDAGLTPYQALLTGTRNVAAYLNDLDSTGTVAVGKRANLVLLSGNPLNDIRQTQRIAGVMLGGQWLDRAELDRRTAAIRAELERRCTAAAAGADPASPFPCLPAEWMPWGNRLKRETR